MVRRGQSALSRGGPGGLAGLWGRYPVPGREMRLYRSRCSDRQEQGDVKPAPLELTVAELAELPDALQDTLIRLTR